MEKLNMKNFEVLPIKAFKDNYIWALIEKESGMTIIIDPGEAQPVVDFIKNKNLRLTNILITHHHHDHHGGVANLFEKYSPTIYSPMHPDINADIESIINIDNINYIDIPIFGRFKIIKVPGHTLEHVAYYHENGWLFCGDTLFSAGCGRVFEGTYEQMYSSLLQLRSLPKDTKVYCAHEYTLSNLEFAKAVEPSNLDIQNMIVECKRKRENNLPTLPSILSSEININPFLRCEVPAIVKSAQIYSGKSLKKAVNVFQELRIWKNSFV